MWVGGRPPTGAGSAPVWSSDPPLSIAHYDGIEGPFPDGLGITPAEQGVLRERLLV